MRAAMFDKNTGQNLLNPDCTLYQEIAKIAQVMRTTEPLRFGRMYFRQISGDGVHFGLPYGTTYTLAFSRMLYGHEVLVAYNVADQDRHDCVIVDASFHKKDEQMHFLYGKSGSTTIQQAPDGALYVQLDLGPRQFVILQ
jgi:alpha-amylase